MVSKQVIRVIIEAEETISKAAKQAEKAIKDMGVSGKQSMEGINQASNTAQQTMSRMEKVVNSAKTKFDSLRKSGSNAFDKIKQKVGSAVNSIGKITNVSDIASKAMDKLKGVSDGIKSKFNSLKNSISSFGSQFDNLKNKIVNFSSTAKNSITQAFTSATSSAKGKLAGLDNSIAQARAKLNQFSASAKSAGGGLGFLRSAASMTVGMIGYDLVNSMAQSARESINAAGNFQAFGKRMNMSQSEIDSFSQHCDKLQQSFKKVDMKAVGASALEMGVKLKLPKESMEELTKTTAVMSSAFVKEGRTQEDAILAVSDAMDGQFRRLQELGISQDQLKNNGWDGDINNKTSLLQAMNKTLDEMGFTDTAMQVNTLDEAYQMLSVSGGQLLGSILIPLTPTLIGIATAVVGVIDGIKNFMGQLQAAWSGLPDWVQDAAGIMVMAGAVLLLMGYISSLGGAVGLLKTALAPIIGIIGGITAPMIAVVAVIGAVIFAVYELGKAFGWWNDVGSMIDAIKNNIGRLWNAFINHPDVQGLIKGIQSAWQGLNDFLKPVIDWLGGIWDQMFPESAKGKVDGTRIIIDAIGAAFAMLKPIISPIPAIIGGVISILSALWSVAQPIGQGIYNALKPIVCILLGCSPGIVPALRTVQEVFTSVWNAIVGFISGVISSVVSAIQPLIDILTQIVEFYLSAFIFAWQTIIFVFNIVIATVSQIMGIFSAFLSGQINLSTMLSMLWNTISVMFASVLSGIISRVTTFASMIVTKAISAARGFVNAIINRIRSLPGRVYSLLIAIVSRIVSAGVRWISSARSAASSMVSNVISNISKLPGKVYTEFMNIGSRIVSAGSDLVNKAKNIGKDIVNGLLGAMGIHSPGIIQTKVVTEFKDMVGRVNDWVKPAGETAKKFGETVVNEFGNPSLEVDTSLVQDLDNPTMNVGMDTDQLDSQYGDLTNLTGNSLQSMVSQDKLAFDTIKANDTAQMTSITALVGTKMQQMTNNVKSNMNSIVLNNKQGFISAKKDTTTQLNSMVSKTKTANSKMISSWKKMSSDVISFAAKIKNQSSQHFDKLGSKIGAFYRKLQNPGGFGAGPSSPSGKVSNVKRSGTNGFKSVKNALKKYQMPQTVSLSEIRTNPFISMDNIGSYITGTNNRFNLADLIRAGNIKIPIGLEDPSKGAGWSDGVMKHVQKIKSLSDKWRMKGPKIIGKYATSIGFKVGDFENGTPNIDFGTFKQIAEDVFSQCHYEFYYDSDKYGSWQAAFRNGGMNCSDSSDALIALANACGLSASKVHGHWGSVGHFWANVAGHKMDTTGWMNQRNWTPAASHAGPAQKGLTFGEFVDAIKSENDSTVVVNNNSNESEVNLNGEVTVVHKFENLPDNVDEATIVSMINKTTSSDGWVKKLANNIRFQLEDLKAKSKIESKQKRSRGI